MLSSSVAAYDELVEEVGCLRARVTEYEEAEQRQRELAGKGLGVLGQLPFRLIFGGRVLSAFRGCWDAHSSWLRSGRVDSWPEATLRDLMAATLEAILGRLLVGLLVALFPFLAILAQTYLLARQTEMLSQQNSTIAAQTTLLERQIRNLEDAIVRVTPEAGARIESGAFKLQITNLGDAEIANILVMGKQVLVDRLIASVPDLAAGWWRTITGGPVARPKGLTLAKGDTFEFEVRLNPQFPDLDLKERYTLFVGLAVRYERRFDSKRYQEVIVLKSTSFHEFIENATEVQLENEALVRGWEEASRW